MSQVRLVWITPDAEKLIAYMSRVSSNWQDNPDYKKLFLRFIDRGEWSPFEMVNACVEIQTSRAISHQLIRHKSASFQEFSQRYQVVQSFESIRPRRQDTKNRQSTIDDLDPKTIEWFDRNFNRIVKIINWFYQKCLERGIGKESARFILPEAASTTIYMNATLRTWIHYLGPRTAIGTQKEHREVAEQIKSLLEPHFPVLYGALGWSKETIEEPVYDIQQTNYNQ